MPTPHETLARFFPAMFNDDRETLRELITADTEWHVPPFAVGNFGELHGCEAILDFLCTGGDAFYRPGSFSMETEVQAIEDDRAVVICRFDALTIHDQPYSNRYAFGFRFRQGRICEAWELLDSLRFRDQLNLP